jgi:hypothetical protein
MKSIERGYSRISQFIRTRAIFILKKDYLAKINALDYWERKSIKEIMDEVLSSYLKGKERGEMR